MAGPKSGHLLLKGIEMNGNDRANSLSDLPTSFAYVSFMDVPRVRGVRVEQRYHTLDQVAPLS